jgi:hypothetical protein
MFCKEDMRAEVEEFQREEVWLPSSLATMSVDGCQSGNTFLRALKRRVTEFVKRKTEHTK